MSPSGSLVVAPITRRAQVWPLLKETPTASPATASDSVDIATTFDGFVGLTAIACSASFPGLAVTSKFVTGAAAVARAAVARAPANTRTIVEENRPRMLSPSLVEPAWRDRSAVDDRGSNMCGEHAVEGRRYPIEVQRLDEEARIAGLAPAAAAHEAAQLILDRSSSPLDLFLERSKRRQVSVRLDHFQYAVGSESSDQLGLQVRVAHVETQGFHRCAVEVRAEARPLEAALELACLAGVAEAHEVEAAEPCEEHADRLRSAHRDHRDALVGQVAAAPLGERLQRDL